MGYFHTSGSRNWSRWNKKVTISYVNVVYTSVDFNSPGIYLVLKSVNCTCLVCNRVGCTHRLHCLWRYKMFYTHLVSVVVLILVHKAPKHVLFYNSIFDSRHVLYVTTPKPSTSERNVLKLSFDVWYWNYDHNRWDNFIYLSQVNGQDVPNLQPIHIHIAGEQFTLEPSAYLVSWLS
jgi:hypothetical protein